MRISLLRRSSVFATTPLPFCILLIKEKTIWKYLYPVHIQGFPKKTSVSKFSKLVLIYLEMLGKVKRFTMSRLSNRTSYVGKKTTRSIISTFQQYFFFVEKNMFLKTFLSETMFSREWTKRILQSKFKTRAEELRGSVTKQNFKSKDLK